MDPKEETTTAIAIENPAPRKSSILSRAEWLVLLPAAPSPLQAMSGASPPADPAADLRNADPLTLDSFTSILSKWTPSLAISVRVQRATEPWATRPVLRGTLLYLVFVPLLAVPWVFNDGRFGSVQLAVGTSTLALAFFASSVGITLFAVYQAGLKVMGNSTTTVKVASRDYSSHGAAGLARWIQLASKVGSDSAVTALLGHNSKDDLCPCPNVQCAGRLPRRADVLRIVDMSFRLSLLTFSGFSYFWTPLVSTGIAQRTWTTPWSAVFGGLTVAALLNFGWPAALVRFSTNVPLLQLSNRIGCRAMKLASEDMLCRYRLLIDTGAQWTRGTTSERQLYMDLHILFTSSWRRRILQYTASVANLFASSVNLLMGLINIAACSCLPACFLLYLVYTLAMNLIDLVNVSAANAQISDVRSLYADVSSELRELRRIAYTAPSRPDPDVIAALEADAEVLGSYLDVDRYRLKFLGFVMTYGVVRTLFATLLTLGIGLWSILRGLGVFVTMETICPIVGP
ncbi:hypothetical protein DFJ74DRAFT_696950 [Hyaloraphidium curvatum]|nr:hypothetical protein DFJ74DRAFT_696950 [Hyaloraphidium curvatum]